MLFLMSKVSLIVHTGVQHKVNARATTVDMAGPSWFGSG